MRKGGGISSPPYLLCHSGPCIVAGSAACLHADLLQAWREYPDAPVIAVNGAAREVDAFALYSIHVDRFLSHRWVHWQQRNFGGGFSTHSRNQGADYQWDISGGGGSAWDARKVAALMGFDLIILCGCPMEPGPYVGGHSFGGYMQDVQVVDKLFHCIVEDISWHHRCISMSGRTKQLLDEQP